MHPTLFIPKCERNSMRLPRKQNSGFSFFILFLIVITSPIIQYPSECFLLGMEEGTRRAKKHLPPRHSQTSSSFKSSSRNDLEKGIFLCFLDVRVVFSKSQIRYFFLYWTTKYKKGEHQQIRKKNRTGKDSVSSEETEGCLILFSRVLHPRKDCCIFQKAKSFLLSSSSRVLHGRCSPKTYVFPDFLLLT